MYEFRFGPWFRAALILMCSGLIALFGWALLQYTEDSPLVYFLAIVPASVAMIGLCIYGIAETLVGRFVIDEDELTLYTPIGKRSLKHSDVWGYKMGENYIRIVPLDSKQKELKVSYYFKGSSEIAGWLAENFNSLGSTDEDEVQQVLDNDELGITEEQRLERLERARKVARVINGGAWALLVWLFLFAANFYEAGILVCAVYPIMVIFVGLRYRGLMSPDEYDNSRVPSVGLALILPGMALALRAVLDFNVLEFPGWVWIAVVIGSFVMTILFMLPSFKLATKPGRFYITGLSMCLLNTFYAYGILIMTNCLLDKSIPAEFETQVANKRISRGESTTYYVVLKPWGTLSEEQEMSVTPGEFESVDKGDEVTVLQHAGYLKVKWITLQFKTG